MTRNTALNLRSLRWHALDSLMSIGRLEWYFTFKFWNQVMQLRSDVSCSDRDSFSDWSDLCWSCIVS